MKHDMTFFRPKILISNTRAYLVSEKLELKINYLVIIFNFNFTICPIWQNGLWSFQAGGTKLKRILPKNQRTQKKLLNFENWVNGEVSKVPKFYQT